MSSQVLLYHGVTKYKSIGIENYSGKHIKKSIFEKQMKFLKKYKKVVPFRDIMKSDNSIAITFDDTFRNVYTTALPILKKYNLPATFFITTGFIGTKKNFWVDKLEKYVDFASVDEIEYNISGKKNLLKLNSKKNKIFSINVIKNYLKKQSPKKRNLILKNLRKILKPKNVINSKNYQNLSWNEVKELHQPPLYEVGGHTVNHEILSYLKKKDLDFEIKKCLNDLRKKTRAKIDLFSYPEGQKKHFNIKVIKTLKKNKIIMCPSAIYGIVSKKQNNFNLKRKMVGFNNLPFPVKK